MSHGCVAVVQNFRSHCTFFIQALMLMSQLPPTVTYLNLSKHNP